MIPFQCFYDGNYWHGSDETSDLLTEECQTTGKDKSSEEVFIQLSSFMLSVSHLTESLVKSDR